jgi:hypothetical protein
VPQIGPFGDALALMNTADVTPITVERWSGGTLDRGVPTGGAYAAIAFPAPYVVLPGAGPDDRELRADGHRERGSIVVLSGQPLIAGSPPLGRPDRVTWAGRTFVVRASNDWVAVSGYHGATCDLVDEPDGEGA